MTGLSLLWHARAMSIPVARLSSFYFAYYAALGGFSPYWSLYLHKLGQDAATISILMSLWYATRVVAPSLWGYAVARSPRPIRWLHLGCALTFASFLAFVRPLDFAGLFAAMCVFCFAYNAVMPQFEALTLSHLTGRSERYGSIRMWGSIGFIAVVGVLGVLLDRFGADRLPLLMLPLFAGLLATSFVNDYGGEQRRRENADASFYAYLKRREVAAFLVSALLMQISFGSFYTFFAIYLGEHGYGAGAVGAFWTIGVGFEIAVFFFGAPLLTRWDARHVVAAALVCACLRWLVTALFPDSVALIAFAQMLHAITFAGFFAGSMQLLAEFFPGRMNGHGQGVFYGFSSGIGGVSGALLSGLIWKHGGGQAAFLAGAGVAALGAAIWIFARGPRAQAVSNG